MFLSNAQFEIELRCELAQLDVYTSTTEGKYDDPDSKEGYKIPAQNKAGTVAGRGGGCYDNIGSELRRNHVKDYVEPKERAKIHHTYAILRMEAVQSVGLRVRILSCCTAALSLGALSS